MGAFGSKPQVPAFTPVSTQAAQATAIGANTANSGAAQSLAASTNAFNQDQLLKMLGTAIPGYDAMVKQAGTNINSELQGQLPKDVQDQIQSSDAARALGGGYGGSRSAGNLTARDLGLTSLNLTQQGLDSASRWIQTSKSTAVPGQFDVSSMFVSPSQQISVDTANNSNAFQRDWLQNQIAAMPDPNTAALYQGLSQETSSISSAAGSAAGGSSGGM